MNCSISRWTRSSLPSLLVSLPSSSSIGRYIDQLESGYHQHILVPPARARTEQSKDKGIKTQPACSLSLLSFSIRWLARFTWILLPILHPSHPQFLAPDSSSGSRNLIPD